MKKKLLNVVLILVIVYLFISAICVFTYIDFGTPPETVGMGFVESANTFRVFMGLPKTFTTYGGVGPIYLIQVIVKICVGVILTVFLFNKNRKK